MLRTDRLPAFLTALRLNGFAVGLPERQRSLDLLMNLQATGTMPDNSEHLSNMLGAVLCRSAQQQVQFRREFANHFGTWKGRQPPRGEGATQAEPRIEIGAQAKPTGDPPDGLAPAHRQMATRAAIVVLLLAGLFVMAAILKTGFVARVPRPAPAPSAPNSIFELLPDWLFSALEMPRAVIEAMQTTFGPATLLLVYVVFIVAALWVVAPSRPFAAYMSRRRVDYRPQLVQLLVKPSTFNPFLDGSFARRVQDLRRPRLVQSRDLDVDESLSATLDRAGLFSPVFAFRRIAPEYLVLIDRRSGNDHVARYAESLVAALVQMRIYVDLYYYTGDFRRLFAGIGAASITFEEVTGRHPEHRLVIIGAGERFFDPVSGRLLPWAARVKSFQRRILLTPTPRELWGYREETLQEGLEMAVIPIGPDAISAMVEFLAKDDPPRPLAPTPERSARAAAMAKLADLLDDRPLRWVEDGIPDEMSLGVLDQALRLALPRSDYDWLSACAVYPEINWQLTVHLGLALPAVPLRRAETIGRLLHFVSLPWFRFGRMPSWLRQLLVDEMSAGVYRNVHRTLEALLLSTLVPASGKFAIEAALERGQALVNSEAVESRLNRAMRDSVLIDFMTRLRKDRTVVRLPAAVARFLKQDGLLRNIFTREPQDEVAAGAQIVANEVEAAGLETFDVTPAEEVSELGPELRLVAQTFDGTGARVKSRDGYHIYLPAGTKPARLLDGASATLYRRRRDLARRLSTRNLIVVLVIALVLYGGVFTSANAFNDINSGIAAIMATLLIVSPFVILNGLLVWPIVRRFSLFPACRSVGDAPPYAATRFTIESPDSLAVRPVLAV
jgi:hypothetical protein